MFLQTMRMEPDPATVNRNDLHASRFIVATQILGELKHLARDIMVTRWGTDWERTATAIREKHQRISKCQSRKESGLPSLKQGTYGRIGLGRVRETPQLLMDDIGGGSR